MNKNNKLLFISSVFILVVSLSFAQYDMSKIKTSKKLSNLIKNDLLTWINSKEIIKDVNMANSKHMLRKQSQIDKIDSEWKKGGAKAIVDEITNSSSSVFLKKVQNESKGIYSEAFVMDFQGCNVGMTGRTSDYWQGDEDKFIKSYNNGKGAVYIGEVEFDESSQSYQVQISLPLVDPATKKVIGAITIGVNMENL